MDYEGKSKSLFGLKLFDLTVIVIILTLIAGVAITVFIDRPASKGKLVAYLYPASGNDVPNIWLSSPDNPADVQQVTFSAMGVYDFAVDRNGQSIAYTMRDDIYRTRDIYLLDLDSGNTRQITHCGDEGTECYSPVFHPHDPVIAYVRIEDDTPRIQVVDLVNGDSRELSSNDALAGHSPLWSDDGNTIAFYSADLSAPGVMVYNFNPQVNDTQTLNYVPAYNGSVGALSPNGLNLMTLDIVNRGEQVFSYLKLINFEDSPATSVNFSDPDGVTDDLTVQWHPGGQHVTVGRRYTDDRWTQGYQLFQINTETGEEEELLFDSQYGHYFFTWDDAGENLLMQRLHLLNGDGSNAGSLRPEIVVLDTTTGKLISIADHAYSPRWVIRK